VTFETRRGGEGSRPREPSLLWWFSVGVLSVCVVFGPAWIAGNGSDLSTADRLAAENDVQSTLLQGFGGLLALGGVAVGAVMTLRQVRANREGHSIDLFTKAIDQLASDQVSVRHGGVYAQEQLSELDARYRGMLTPFSPRSSVGMHHGRPSPRNPRCRQQGHQCKVAWPTTSEPHWPYSAGGR
jgi:hypothetical protein